MEETVPSLEDHVAFCSTARKKLETINGELRVLPGLIVTDSVRAAFNELAIVLGKIEEIGPSALGRIHNCRNVCRIKDLFLEYEQCESKFYSILFFNTLELYFDRLNDPDGILDNNEWIPSEEARKQLEKTPMEYLNILERGELETDRQEDYKEYQHSGLNNPFYRVKDFPDLKVHLLSLQRYKEREAKKQDDDGSTPWGTLVPKETMNLVFPDPRIAELEAELAHARQAIESMAQGIEPLKVESQAKPPKTAKGTGAAMDRRLKEWKGYTSTIAKVAYQCGLEDRKEFTRTDFKKAATPYGGFSDAALDVLRDALPEVAKRTPGVPKTG